MFHQSDPRSALTVKDAPTPHGQGHYPTAEYVNFHSVGPGDADQAVRTWYVRGQHFLVAYSEAIDATTLSRSDQPDEYMVLLPDRAMKIRVSVEDFVMDVGGFHLVIVPPGASTIATMAAGRLVRIFTTQSEDLATKCINAESYRDPHRYVARFEGWPSPPGGFRVRSYDLAVPPRVGRFGRIYRSTNLMVNVHYPWLGPRDASRLSPHHHDDLEQGTLALDGEFMGHHRWAWTPNRHEWREDEHELLAGPSFLVIPPPAIHTTEAIGQGVNRLVDIFAPPRADFFEQPGWVLNAEDYPSAIAKGSGSE